MSAARVEAFLARLYSDAELRTRFLADPEREARSFGLAEDEAAAFLAIDRTGLVLAARSFARKRATHIRTSRARRVFRSLLARVHGWLR